jgi:hypothetical protein
MATRLPAAPLSRPGAAKEHQAPVLKEGPALLQHLAQQPWLQHVYKPHPSGPRHLRVSSSPAGLGGGRLLAAARALLGACSALLQLCTCLHAMTLLSDAVSLLK